MDDRPLTLQQQYQLRFGECAAYRRDVWKILCADFFARYVRPDATVLDVGAGWGEFINTIAAGRKLAMDLNPDLQTHLSPDVEHLHQDCSRDWPIPAGALDVVFTSNFLEHLPDKASVERTVAQAHRGLKDGGLLICLGPNVKYVPGAYWDFWDHHIPLTESSVAELLRMNGFAVDVCLPRFLPFSMSTGRRVPLGLVRLYLRLPPAWPLFGKQFLVIGRKRAESPTAERDSTPPAA